ncbi:hypothetical protein GGR14_000093 [Butyricimonas faecihominis]|uniref:Uncharacterized protein n=1 Tax=Butyricimonas faecihominis TaxID=1472416 RepID=A0A7W6MWU3_9BACT|nr:hypothetical protein [Butyricimonas faecihominis]
MICPATSSTLATPTVVWQWDFTATVSASVSMAGSAGTVCHPLSSDGLPDSRKAITCAGSAAGFSMQVRLWWQNARTDG